jgi:hypothetical protein
MLLWALEHVYNYVVCGLWNTFTSMMEQFTIMLLRAPEHVYIFDIVVHGTCLQLCCCGPWNMFTTMLSAGPGTRYIFDIAVLEPIYNNNMLTTMLFAGPGTCLQLCCLRALKHICGEKPLYVCVQCVEKKGGQY